jgi:hypothetical protein
VYYEKLVQLQLEGIQLLPLLVKQLKDFRHILDHNQYEQVKRMVPPSVKQLG